MRRSLRAHSSTSIATTSRFWHARFTVRPGDLLLVRNGEFVPVDGSLTGYAQLDESTLTGESAIQQRSQLCKPSAALLSFPALKEP
jgi:P-type E1-E2 ATPase